MAWLNDTRVEALWVNDEEANVWGWIDGAWRKFEDGHADACTNFAILAAHAKCDDRSVHVRVEGDRIKEMYVW